MSDKPPAPTPADQSSNPKPTAPKATYISRGQMLESPPLTARLSRFVDNAYNFFGLYFVSLFAMDPYTAAQNSQFNTRGPAGGSGSTGTRARWGVGGGGAGGSGGGNGPRGGGGGGRRLGTVDDVRGPECGSCG